MNYKFTKAEYLSKKDRLILLFFIMFTLGVQDLNTAFEILERL